MEALACSSFDVDARGVTEQRLSWENPSVSLSDPEAWDEAFGETKSVSGIRVNRQTALRLSGVYRGVSLLSGALAKLPFYPFRWEESGKQTRDLTIPGGKFVRLRACRETSAFHLKQTLTGHAILQGGGFAYIYRNQAGEPIDIVPLLPDRTCPVRVNGRLYYVTSLGGTLDDPASELRRLAPENVLHIHGFGFDGLTGYSLLKVAVEGFGGAIARQQFGNVFFENAATPKFTIEAPEALSDKAYARLQATWQKMKAGLKSAHKAVILEEGAKANALTINPAESQLLESKEFDLITIANYLGLPPHKVGAKGNSAYASLEQSNQEYLDDALEPWLVAWEQECSYKLLTKADYESENVKFEFVRQAMVRSNLAQRAAYYRTALGGLPWMVRKEVRSLENLDPTVPESEFKDPLNIGNLAKSAEGGQKGGERVRSSAFRRDEVLPEGGTTNQRLVADDLPLGEDDDEDDRETSLREAHVAVVREAVGRMVKRVRSVWDRCVDAAKVEKFFSRFDEDHGDVISQALTPAGALCRRLPMDAKARVEHTLPSWFECSVLSELQEHVGENATRTRESFEKLLDGLPDRAAELV